MFNYLLYRIGQFIALCLPIKIAYAIAVFSSDIHSFFADKDRAAVKANLKIIFPEKTSRQIRRIRLGMARNFAKYLVDFFRFSKLNLEFIKKNIRIENLNYVDDSLRKKKGVILLTAHLGNWELGGVVISLLGYPLWAVALPHKDKRVNDFFNHQRESKGLRVIQLGRAVRQCMRILKDKQIIALVGDRDFNEKGAVLDFFGKPAFFPEGPAAFALNTGAPIIPGYMVRNPDNSFTLRFEKPLEFAAGGDKKEDIKRMISDYKTIIEGWIRRYPEQWYMFRKFWLEPGKNEDLRNYTHL